MIALQITDTRQFMNQLLLQTTFDSFLIIEGTIVTANEFHIDGFIRPAFFEGMEQIPEYSSWSEVKDYCFQIIKGKRTPLSMNFTFSLNPKSIATAIQDRHLDLSPESVKGLYLNFQYDGETVQCVTGTSFQSFVMDKTLEQAWDQMAKTFFEQKGLSVTEL